MFIIQQTQKDSKDQQNVSSCSSSKNLKEIEKYTNHLNNSLNIHDSDDNDPPNAQYNRLTHGKRLSIFIYLATMSDNYYDGNTGDVYDTGNNKLSYFEDNKENHHYSEIGNEFQQTEQESSLFLAQSPFSSFSTSASIKNKNHNVIINKNKLEVNGLELTDYFEPYPHFEESVSSSPLLPISSIQSMSSISSLTTSITSTATTSIPCLLLQSSLRVSPTSVSSIQSSSNSPFPLYENYLKG